MPSGVSIASADQNLARAIEELNRESAEARDHLAATSEILGIISSSPELLSFPNSKNDDQVDSTVFALAWMTENNPKEFLTDEGLERLRRMTNSLTGYSGLPTANQNAFRNSRRS